MIKFIYEDSDVEELKKWFAFGKITRTRLIVSGAFALAIAILSVFVYKLNNINFIVSAFLWGALAFGILNIPLEIKQDAPYGVRLAIMFIFTIVEFMLMQNTISIGTEKLSVTLFVFNVVLLFTLKAIIWAASGSMKASIIASSVFCYAIAIADYIVVQARGFEIQFSDISSISTAAGVAAGYLNVDYWPEMRLGVMHGILLICAVAAIKFPKREYSVRQIVYSASPLILTIICGSMVFNPAATRTLGITEKYWQYMGSELNGFFVNIVYSASATRVLEPSDYTLGGGGDIIAALDDLLNKDPNKGETEDVTPPKPETPPEGPVEPDKEEKKPHVIVIMNETFSDIESVMASQGKEVVTETGEEILPFYHTLNNDMPNVIKGDAIASVYGGNTANSEFEFLTGMSMAFLPRNTVAYNFYLEKNNTFSIVESFNEAGYTTIGMHPENATNWKRDTIYNDYYGFDKTYFRDDFTGLDDPEDWYRGYVSDKAVYDKIIELYEGREEDESLFTFAVTMQNHGGYQNQNFDYKIKVEGANTYANEYFTSVNNSDAALEYLLTYFAEAEEEVIIVFFGDHQPSVTYIRKDMLGIEENADDAARIPQYTVPYLYWSNTEIDCAVPEVTSLNFLSTYLLDLCGVEKTVFQNFLSSINTDIIAINAMGWMDVEGNFTTISYGGELDNSYLDWYSSLQYNALFDENKLVDLFSIKASHANTAPEDGEDTTVPDDTTAQEPDTGKPETDEFGNLLGEEPGDKIGEETIE